jgi:acetyl-CoA C-acetyltransferase
MIEDKEVYIIDGMRTAIGRMGGSLSGFRPEELASIALKGLIEKTRIDPAIVDEVMIGHACTNNAAVNIARWALLKAGFPVTVPGQTVERQCGSGLQTVNTAALSILAGQNEVCIAGGCESWSRQPYMMERQEKPFSLAPPSWIVHSTGPDEATNVPMGIIAEGMAEKWGCTREEQDVFALRSQTRALKAIAAGYFKEEIVPVPIRQKKGDPIIFDTDEHPRATSMEKLSALKPAFQKIGTVTAGNSSGMNDGGVAVLLMSGKKCKELSLKPIARFVSCALAGVEPKYMGIGPAYATPKALAKAGLKLEDMDVIECNEAFASQTLSVMKELAIQGHKVIPERWNPNGGAIAFGHPNGMSGGRLTIGAIKELHRNGGKYALVTICIGGGQGIATIFEKV